MFKPDAEIPTKQTVAANVLSLVLGAWIMFGDISDSIFTDIGPKYVGKIFNAACLALSTQVMMTTAYHPYSNGRTERYGKNINRLRHYIRDLQNDWDDYAQPLV